MLQVVLLAALDGKQPSPRFEELAGELDRLHVPVKVIDATKRLENLFLRNQLDLGRGEALVLSDAEGDSIISVFDGDLPSASQLKELLTPASDVAPRRVANGAA